MDSKDNSNLERQIVIITQGAYESQSNHEFLNLLKDSHLIMPVLLCDGSYEIDGIRFDINYIKIGSRNQAVALFTSDDLMLKSGLRSSSIILNMHDLAEILREVPDKYALISVNPVTDLSINISTDEFLDLF